VKKERSLKGTSQTDAEDVETWNGFDSHNLFENEIAPFFFTSVRPEMVDFGLGQGRSDFTTAGEGYVEDCKEREHRPGSKDAVYGWALINWIQQLLNPNR